MEMKLVSDSKSWWEENRVYIKSHPDISFVVADIDRIIDSGLVSIFVLGENGGDGFIIVSAAIKGITINLIYSGKQLAIKKYIENFMSLMKLTDYTKIYAVAISESRRRLYSRYGFVSIGNGLMVRSI